MCGVLFDNFLKSNNQKYLDCDENLCNENKSTGVDKGINNDGSSAYKVWFEWVKEIEDNEKSDPNFEDKIESEKKLDTRFVMGENLNIWYEFQNEDNLSRLLRLSLLIEIKIARDRWALWKKTIFQWYQKILLKYYLIFSQMMSQVMNIFLEMKHILSD